MSAGVPVKAAIARPATYIYLSLHLPGPSTHASISTTILDRGSGSSYFLKSRSRRAPRDAQALPGQQICNAFHRSLIHQRRRTCQSVAL